jgi:hypothetical protein
MIDQEPQTMKTRCSVMTKAVAFGAGVAVTLAVTHFGFTSTVMSKESPDDRHSARLDRVDGIDVMFDVVVDGTRVYRTHDFAPGPFDFREHIYWTADSQSVILEVAGNRLYGYDVTKRRALTDTELANVALTDFRDLGFEGD